MRYEGYGAGGQGHQGDVKVGAVRFELRDRRVKNSPTRIRHLPPEVAAEQARIAKKRSRGAVRQRHDYDRRTAQPSTTTPAEIDRMVRLYKGGMTAPDVAKEVDKSLSTVLRYLKERGVETRGRRKAPVPSSETVAKIVADYESGNGIRVVAERYGISTTQVRRLLADNDVEIRSQGAWRAIRAAQQEKE